MIILIQTLSSQTSVAIPSKTWLHQTLDIKNGCSTEFHKKLHYFTIILFVNVPQMCRAESRIGHEAEVFFCLVTMDVTFFNSAKTFSHAETIELETNCPPKA